jgi:hypothetical protein
MEESKERSFGNKHCELSIAIVEYSEGFSLRDSTLGDGGACDALSRVRSTCTAFCCASRLALNGFVGGFRV